MSLNMVKCLLLICICSVVFHRCAGQEETSVPPVRGFIGLDTLRRNAVLLYNSVEQLRQQRVFPSMNFSCSGTISKWTFVARSQTGRNRDQYPRFQLWRPNGTGRYERVYESSITSTMSGQSQFTLEEYIPDSPVPFEAGYIFGVYQPRGGDSRLSVRYADVSDGYGYLNYRRRSDTSLEVFNIGEAQNRNDYIYPLVAVNTTSPQCVQGFLDEESVRIAADVYATSNTNDVRTHERQQRIIPGINFTCTGTLTKWIIGARRRTQTQASNYPQLQIWRQRQGSSNTYDRTDFSDITALNTTGYLNVYEYIPNPPLQFQTNDILGLYQPRIRDTQIVVYYQEGGGTQNFARSNQNSPITITGRGNGNDLPLVAIEVNGRSAGSCIEEFITTGLPTFTTGLPTFTTGLPTFTTGLPTYTMFSSPETTVPAVGSTKLLVSTLLLNPGTTAPVGSSTGLSAPTTLPKPGTTIPVRSINGLLVSTTLPNPGNTPPPVAYTPAFSLLPTPGSDRSPVNGSPAGAIAGALVGVMVVVVAAIAAVLLVILVLRRRQRKSPNEPDSQEKTVENPIYAGEAVYHYAEVESKPTQSVYHNNHTLEPHSAHQENQPQYEVPVPQQRNVYKSNERYATCYNWGLYVPTEGDRKAFKTTPAENIYASLSESQYSSVGPDPTFFEESATYWSPASDSEGLYQQLADKKYREILRHQIQITEHLGSGQFGTVNKGIWQSPAGAVEVAVKTLQSSASQEDRVKFLQEAAINGQFRHPNVVKLLGVITVGEPVMIVLELLTNGDLRNYLIKQRPVPGEMVPSDTPHTLLVFCKDVASGMQYLAGKSFVHRDLAARNILVAGDKTCKIADFGMSRDLMDENYYMSHGGQIPVKWTAPEALHFKKYSTASDVWSYGAVMYEIWSLGHKPFEEYSNLQAMKLVDRGYRLPPPPGCSKALYELMIQCWNADKPSRPDFAELVHALSSPVTDLLNWSEEDMRVHPQAAVLGAPLEAGKDLYPELQGTYMHDY